MPTYKYFCGNCGHKFTSEKPERDVQGWLNDIACPECGSWDTYPDTPEGVTASVRDQLDYEDRLIEQRIDED